MSGESGYELVRVRSGAWGVRSREYNEVWHPGIGPVAEAEAMYVEGLDLRQRMRVEEPGEPFVVWDVGLGGGGNATTVLRTAVALGRSVRVVSFDRTLAGLEFALGHAKQLGYWDRFAPAALELVEGRGAPVRWRDGADLEWSCVIGDFPALLQSRESTCWPVPHVVLFDPHSPRVNPEMWSVGVFRGIRERLEPGRGTSLGTYSRSTAVRNALLVAGFWVGLGPATAFKEESTVAANRSQLLRKPLGPEWLKRVRSSGSAEPTDGCRNEPRPISEATWKALTAHPQMMVGT